MAPRGGSLDNRDAPAARQLCPLPRILMDLLSVLPDFVTKSYAHILPPLERSKITTVDLITLETLEIAKRAHVPPADVRRLSAQIIEALHADLGFEKNQADIGTSSDAEPSSSINPDSATITPGPTTKLQASRWNTISTLDPAMDALLGGGIPMGYVTEITGERYVSRRIELEINDMALTLVNICLQWQRQDPIPPQPPSSGSAG